MYTKLLNVQILVALLKRHGIRHIVLSAGTRQVPLARSVEADPFFVTYSVVDERSAGYFALGIAKRLGEPVGITCTSSTATCNYLPAIAEASYQHIPLLVMTGDRDGRYLEQMEDQMIPQLGMYTRFCKRCVDLAPIKAPPEPDDFWVCERLVNEALISLRQGKPGPVQINYHVIGAIQEIADASVEQLPQVTKINLHEMCGPVADWEEKARELAAARRILVIAGQAHRRNPDLDALVEHFASRYSCVVAVENTSNLKCDCRLNTFLAVQSLAPQGFKEHLPDIVISFGGNFISALKAKLRVNARRFSHWLVDEDGQVHDGFKSLTDVFACTPEHFFRFFVEHAPRTPPDSTYARQWAETVQAVHLPEIPYSNLYAIRALVSRLPDKALLHTGILNATRIMEFFPLPKHVEAHSNIGTHGIDGSMSTFFGQASATDLPCYLVVGDLSFFYDMNSVRIRHIGKNVRVLLINNEGGAEFHFSMGRAMVPTLDQSISAGHRTSAEAWIKSLGCRYMAARDQQSFDANIDAFMRADQDAPVFFEVFTEKESDGALLRSVFSAIRTNAAHSPAAKVADKMSTAAPVMMDRLGRLKEAAGKLFNKANVKGAPQ